VGTVSGHQSIRRGIAARTGGRHCELQRDSLAGWTGLLRRSAPRNDEDSLQYSSLPDDLSSIPQRAAEEVPGEGALAKSRTSLLQRSSRLGLTGRRGRCSMAEP
jgi:hypothetical protein